MNSKGHASGLKDVMLCLWSTRAVISKSDKSLLEEKKRSFHALRKKRSRRDAIGATGAAAMLAKACWLWRRQRTKAVGLGEGGSTTYSFRVARSSRVGPDLKEESVRWSYRT